MTQGRCMAMGLLTLSTLIPAFGQTQARERNETGPSASRLSSTNGSVLTGPCLAASNELNGNSDEALARLRCGSGEARSRLAERFINERLAVWRQSLNLEEWQISIVMTRRGGLQPKTRGQVKWDKAKKTAAIAVLDASDYELPLAEMLADMEFTVVHELVHLELASLPHSEASRSTEEQAVNRIAEALLRLDRQR